jgi:hypothetical protein
MKEKYSEDLKEIKDIMNRTTRFISLSGLSGVSTGIAALAGAFIAHQYVFKDQQYLVYDAVVLSNETLGYLLLISVGTIIAALINAIFFTRLKAKHLNLSVWDFQSKRLFINLLIPLATGGLFSLMLLQKGFIGFLPSMTLIFYGLALVNGSKYTFPELRILGIIEIFLGLSAFQFIEFGLLIWATGFGVIQIIYGLIIQRKY